MRYVHRSWTRRFTGCRAIYCRDTRPSRDKCREENLSGGRISLCLFHDRSLFSVSLFFYIVTYFHPRNHPLAQEVDVIETLHMRLTLLQMTFGKHIFKKHVCFFPGEVSLQANGPFPLGGGFFIVFQSSFRFLTKFGKYKIFYIANHCNNALSR